MNGENQITKFKNPFTPGAGHQPPYLAGRQSETDEFLRLLGQDLILENMLLTGLRGVGKTVLFDKFRPLAVGNGWCWVGTDLSEAASLTEDNLITRIFTDLAAITSNIVLEKVDVTPIGFEQETNQAEVTLESGYLKATHDRIPGLSSDKLKGTLRVVWDVLSKQGYRGSSLPTMKRKTFLTMPRRTNTLYQ